MILKLYALALCAFTLCAPALAVTTVYTYAGVIDENNTANPVYPFTSFSGSFSFDAATPDGAPGDANNGFYPMFGGLYGMQVTFNDGTVFDVDAVGHYSLNTHVALPSLPGQLPDVGRLTAGGRVLGQTDRFLGLSFLGTRLTDALPTPAGGLTLGSFDEARFSYNGLAVPAPLPGQPAMPQFGAFGHLTALACVDGCPGGIGAITPVPEPETYALMLSGLAVLGWFGRRRRGGSAEPVSPAS